MATLETLTAAIDRAIALFNSRSMDLPDGFFDRKTQFRLNGTAFEALLSSTPNDPLVLMLARGPAGFRFTAKALQHAIPDSRLERGQILTDGDPFKLGLKLWLSGKLRGTQEPIETLVDVVLRLADSGSVTVAEATIDAGDLERIRAARARS